METCKSLAVSTLLGSIYMYGFRSRTSHDTSTLDSTATSFSPPQMEMRQGPAHGACALRVQPEVPPQVLLVAFTRVRALAILQ